MTSAALRPSQELLCVGQDFWSRRLAGHGHWVNVRVGDLRVAARFARLARWSHYPPDWVEE